MKTSRLPIAIQQAVMRSLREKLAQANLKLERQYPEPKLVYQQRGTAAGTAWLQTYEIRLNPVLLMENVDAFVNEVVPMNWRIYWCGNTLAAYRRTGKSGNG